MRARNSNQDSNFAKTYKELQEEFDQYYKELNSPEHKQLQEAVKADSPDQNTITGKLAFLQYSYKKTLKILAFFKKTQEKLPHLLEEFRQNHSFIGENASPIEILEAICSGFFLGMTILEKNNEFRTVNPGLGTKFHLDSKKIIHLYDLSKEIISFIAFLQDIKAKYPEVVKFLNSDKLITKIDFDSYLKDYRKDLTFVYYNITFLIKKKEYCKANRKLDLNSSEEKSIKSLELLKKSTINMLKILENLKNDYPLLFAKMEEKGKNYPTKIDFLTEEKLKNVFICSSFYSFFFSIQKNFLNSQKVLNEFDNSDEKINYLNLTIENIYKIANILETSKEKYLESFKEFEKIYGYGFEQVEIYVAELKVNGVEIFSKQIEYLQFEKEFKKYKRQLKNISREYEKNLLLAEKIDFLESTIAKITNFLNFLEEIENKSPSFIKKHFKKLGYVQQANLTSLIENLDIYRYKCLEKKQEIETLSTPSSPLPHYIEGQISKSARSA